MLASLPLVCVLGESVSSSFLFTCLIETSFFFFFPSCEVLLVAHAELWRHVCLARDWIAAVLRLLRPLPSRIVLEVNAGAINKQITTE